MDFEAIRQLVKDDFDAVNREISDRLRSDVVLINTLAAYIVNSGGKRLRPLLVLLGSRAMGYRGHSHIVLAAIIEFIHTATLLHDDVVDASEMRRGRSTANSIWGNEASVLVGDFLYSRSFEMMVGLGNMRVMEILANTTNIIARGEVIQLMNCHDPDTSEERYMDVIRSKTAKLFEAAARLCAVINGNDSAIETSLSQYGMHLGLAFQLTDDALDYQGDDKTLGKNIGDDLAEGKPTLPIIHAIRTGNEAQRELVRKAIVDGGREQMEDVAHVIESTGSIAYTARRAEQEADLARAALSAIPDSPYKQALEALAHFSVHRRH